MPITLDGTSGISLTGNAGLTQNGNGTISFTSSLAVTGGGTGLTSVGASGNVLTSNGSYWVSQAPTVTASPGTSGNVLTSNGTSWISQTLPPASNTINAPNFTGNIDANGSIRYALTALTGNTVNCAQGNFFTRTASGAASWFINNVPSGRAYTVILELTNGGTGTQTWFANTRWAGGTAPTLTTSGVDVLAFISDDAGANWRGVALMTDSK